MKKYVYLFACVGCMMLSCSHDPEATDVKEKGTNVVEWEDSTINGDAPMGLMMFCVGNVMSVDRQGFTRSTAAYDGTCAFSEGDRIAIRVSRSSVVEDVKLYEVQSDGSLECLDTYPFTWRSLSDAVDIQAWSYGDASTTTAAPEDSDYSLETNQQTNGYKELLYCNAPGTGYSANSITLNFYHQLARVVFNVSHEQSSALSISSKAVGNSTSFPVKASFTPPSGSNTVGTWDFTASTYGTITPKTEATQTNYQATFSAVIFPKTYDQDTELFSVTNSDGKYAYSVQEEDGVALMAGNQYKYTIDILDGDLYLKNPLWYMGKYNVKRKNTSVSWTSTTSSDWVFDTTAGFSQGDYLQWSSVQDYKTYDGCVRTFGSGTPTDGYYAPRSSPVTISEDGISYNWHLGTYMEWLSIFPARTGGPNNVCHGNIPASGSKVTEPECTFGYNDATKYKDGDSSDKTQGNQYTAYWSTSSSAPSYGYCRYAIRFLGTRFCSAWRYQYYCDSHNGSANPYIVVSSHLINQSDANSDEKIATFFTSGHENCLSEKAESYWTEDLSNGIVRRVLYGCGKYYGSNSSNSSTSSNCGDYWTNTEASQDGAWGVSFGSNANSGHAKLWGFSVRLFHDH